MGVVATAVLPLFEVFVFPPAALVFVLLVVLELALEPRESIEEGPTGFLLPQPENTIPVAQTMQSNNTNFFMFSPPPYS